MASVTLETLWLNDALNPADAMAFPLMNKLSASPQVQGEFRQMANGRTRLVTSSGLQQRAGTVLPGCTIEQRKWIEKHTARTLLIRDDRGRKYWGSYLQPNIEEHQYDKACDISLSLTEITVSEAV